MTYLIAKYLLLFLLATLLGFLLGHWWARRRFVDVTESYESMTSRSQQDTTLWDRLWGNLNVFESRLDRIENTVKAIPAPTEIDLSDVHTRIDRIGGMVGQIKPEPVNLMPMQERISGLEALIKGSRPEPVDLNPVYDRITALENLIRNLPATETSEPVDLGPIYTRMQMLEGLVRQIPTPEPVDMQPIMSRFASLQSQVEARGNEGVDFGPINQRMERIEKMIMSFPRPEAVNLAPVNSKMEQLELAIKSIPRPERMERVDLAPVNQRILALEGLIKGMNTNQSAPSVNLQPMSQRIEAVERAIRAIRIPETNLAPIDGRLKEIEARLGKLASAPAPKPATSSNGPRLLKTASFGKKDDLKRISGIGPKLERLCNSIGVYYFWQVASWNKADVEQVDDLLEVFKGRIERDEWVKQANVLKMEPTSAKEPQDAMA